MKTPKSTVIMALVMVLASTNATKAATFGNNGDIYLGFRASQGTGADKNLLIDLGNISTIQSAAYTLNINSLLTSTFGSSTSNSYLYWGILGSDDNTVDAWLGRQSGSAYPPGSAGGTSSAINTDDLVSLNTSYDNIQVAAGQGNAAISSINDSLNHAHGVSISPVGNSGSWSQQILLGYNFFSAPQDSIVGTNGLTLAYYTSDYAGSYLGSNPVDQATILNSLGTSGLITVAPAVIPEPSTYGMVGLGGLVLLASYFRRSRRKEA